MSIETLYITAEHIKDGVYVGPDLGVGPRRPIVFAENLGEITVFGTICPGVGSCIGAGTTLRIRADHDRLKRRVRSRCNEPVV